MAISTLDGVVAGFKQPQFFMKRNTAAVSTRMISLFMNNGIPGPAVISTGGLNGGGALLTSYPGQIPFTNPSGSNKSYLARLSVANRNLKAGIILCDRIWHNSGFNVTTISSQSFTVGGVPCPDFTRDINNGANASKYGEGVFVGIEYYSALSSSAQINVSYTNSDGAPKTGTIGGLNTSMTTGNFEIMNLAAGDTGVRSIQSANITVAAGSGTISFVAFRPIAVLGLILSDTSSAIDALTSGFPELYNNTVPFFLAGTSTGGADIQGTFAVTQG